jgi:hypothetical protein
LDGGGSDGLDGLGANGCLQLRSPGYCIFGPIRPELSRVFDEGVCVRAGGVEFAEALLDCISEVGTVLYASQRI